MATGPWVSGIVPGQRPHRKKNEERGISTFCGAIGRFPSSLLDAITKGTGQGTVDISCCQWTLVGTLLAKFQIHLVTLWRNKVIHSCQDGKKKRKQLLHTTILLPILLQHPSDLVLIVHVPLCIFSREPRKSLLYPLPNPVLNATDTQIFSHKFTDSW